MLKNTKIVGKSQETPKSPENLEITKILWNQNRDEINHYRPIIVVAPPMVPRRVVTGRKNCDPKSLSYGPPDAALRRLPSLPLSPECDTIPLLSPSLERDITPLSPPHGAPRHRAKDIPAIVVCRLFGVNRMSTISASLVARLRPPSTDFLSFLAKSSFSKKKRVFSCK